MQLHDSIVGLSQKIVSSTFTFTLQDRIASLTLKQAAFSHPKALFADSFEQMMPSSFQLLYHGDSF